MNGSVCGLRSMRRSAGAVALAALFPLAAAAPLHAQRRVTARAFHTRATFAVDGVSSSLSTAVATIQPATIAPGYSWVRIYFYAFSLTPGDVASAKAGSVAPMERRWERTSAHPGAYSTSHAVMQLTVDRTLTITQVNLSVPGHTCTIAWRPQELHDFASGYRLDRHHLRLASTGTYVCDMKSLGIPDQTFRWAVNLDVPVFEASANGPPR